ncbi:hypothetical protein FA15DRAFT_564216, partial [Coprinopsis marcescibilis]
MGKLNIAHHKSYHPYRRDNIDRVKRDEEEARIKDEQAEGKILLADTEARIQLLRQRASISSTDKKKDAKKKEREDEKALERQLAGKSDPSSSSSSSRTVQLPTTNGHINLFEDLERSAIVTTTKKTAASADVEMGVPLAPSAKDLNPWYKTPSTDMEAEKQEDDENKREENRKAGYDPLTSITKQLAASKGPSSRPPFDSFRRPRPSPLDHRRYDPHDPQVQARISRESSERERARMLIERRKREAALAARGSETPSTVYGGGEGTPQPFGYSDQFNKEEVLAAHRDGGYGSMNDRKWDEDERPRGRG